MKISGAPVPGVNTEPTPIPVNPQASHEPVSSSCDYKACPIRKYFYACKWAWMWVGAICMHVYGWFGVSV